MGLTDSSVGSPEIKIYAISRNIYLLTNIQYLGRLFGVRHVLPIMGEGVLGGIVVSFDA